MHPARRRSGSRLPFVSIVLAGVLGLTACSPSTPAAAPTSPPAAAQPTTPAAAAASPVAAASPSVAVAASPAAAASASPSVAASPANSPVPSLAPSVVPSPSAVAGTSPAAAAVTAGSLKGVCPDTVVVQTNWWPEPDHGFLYQLIGPNGTIDTNKNAYIGPLGNTGVNAEIRAGGPAIGFQQVTAQMYSDDSILLGMAATDEAIQNSASQPTKGVFAWYARNPQIFFWGNPDWDFQTVSDIGKNGATVLAFSPATFVDVLVGKGALNKSQVDESYTGDPSRFVAADGNIVSQGFITSEPYIYENEVQGWKKPVKFLLLDKEVPIYQDDMAIRTDKLEANRACLQKLVPLMQQSAIDYVKNPVPINNMIVDYTSRIKGGTQISAAGAADAVQRMLRYGIVGNGTDGVYGSYDTAQVQQLINDFGPVFVSRGKPPKEGLQPSDLFTNEFLDKNIHL
jgi:hypothetical protein